VAAEWVSVPESDEHRIVFYLHGGGYTQGSPATHRELVSRVARHSRARVLCIDYRLAPAHPFPAAVEDALTAYEWLLDSGVPASSIALAGDSAGGGLAVAMMLALRDQSCPLPACAACLSPWFDLEGAGPSVLADDDPIVQRQHLLEVAGVYLAGADARHPHASPVYGQLSGLPPMLLQVGTRDLLLDDSRHLESLAKAAGVDVDLEVWPGLIHVWHIWGDGIPEAKAALESVGRFICKHARASVPALS
jgi:acetyl esterase/lipase